MKKLLLLHMKRGQRNETSRKQSLEYCSYQFGIESTKTINEFERDML